MLRLFSVHLAKLNMGWRPTFQTQSLSSEPIDKLNDAVAWASKTCTATSINSTHDYSIHRTPSLATVNSVKVPTGTSTDLSTVMRLTKLPSASRHCICSTHTRVLGTTSCHYVPSAAFDCRPHRVPTSSVTCSCYYCMTALT